VRRRSFEKSVQTPAVIALFFRINRLLCSGIVAEPSDSSFFLKVAGVISLRKINIFCQISMRRNEVGLRGCELHQECPGFFRFSGLDEN